MAKPEQNDGTVHEFVAIVRRLIVVGCLCLGFIAIGFLLPANLAPGFSAVAMSVTLIASVIGVRKARAAEKKINASYRCIFEQSAEGFFQSTPDGRLVSANPALAHLLGFNTTEELIAARNDPTREVNAPDRMDLQRRIRENGGTLKNHEYEIKRRDGDTIWVSQSASVVHDAEGNEIYFVGSVRDITARKHAHEALLRVGRRFQSFLQATSEVLWVVSPEGRILEDSPTWRAYSGQTREEMINYGWATCVHPNDRHQLLKWVASFLANKRTAETEVRIRRADGVYRLFYIRVVPVFNADGSVREWIGANIDITERKEAAERIAQQAALIDQAHDAILVCDLQGRITFWNQGAERLYGYTAAEALGQGHRQLLYDEACAAHFREANRDTMEKGEWCGEMHQLAKDGHAVIAEVRWTLLRDSDGKPKSILAINNNITERKKIEEQFLRAQRLESVGRLASGLAHDLNNVLAPIILAAPALTHETDPVERAKFLEVIKLNASRGAGILKQVLTFARGAEGDRALVQPVELLEELTTIISQTFPKSIQLETNFGPDTQPLEADPTQIHQVLLNLCINARDAMPNGGKLILRARNFLVDEIKARNTPGATAGPHVLLEVIDTGAGIPKEALGNIFDPFFTTKGVGKGTGLGLSTVAGIVKNHGGFVNVYSEPGHTSFRIFLPAHAQVSQSKAAATEEPPPLGRGEVILLVDDEASIREVAQLILEDNGYKALVAGDGATALQLVAKHHEKIAAVLTDLSMPVMDGATLVRSLRALDPEIKIIVSTGRTDGFQPEANIILADDYLTKPYTTRSLLLKLHEILHERAPTAAAA